MMTLVSGNSERRPHHQNRPVYDQKDDIFTHHSIQNLHFKDLEQLLNEVIPLDDDACI